MLIKRLQGQFEKQNGFYYEFDMHSKPLGEGGMGVVYKGFKIYETTGNRSVVAIKAMKTSLPAEVYERAQREASIRLRNDNLVEMLGFISQIEMDPYGKPEYRYYVVSEYLNGVVLSDLLSGQFKDRDGIEIQFAKQLYTKYIADREQTSVEILRSVMTGIMALHDKGYIHRDIDPSNVMVTDDGAVKLIDFGIAKYVKSLGTIDKSLTSTGKFIGKAEFASPELVLGDVKNQGYHTDIYAVGILFYRLLVGHLPFDGTQYEIMQKQLNDKVPVKNVKNSLFDKIIRKATEKNGSDRYPSISELRVEIDKAADATDNWLLRNWKKGVVAIMSVAALVLIAMMIDYFQQFEPPQPPEPPIPHVDYSKEFKEALVKLNSEDVQVAKEGLDLMKELAEKDYSKASEELGLTYCPFSKVQSSVIKDRRDVLGFNQDISELLSVQYLKSIKEDAMSIEALYALGYSYWRQHNWEDGKAALSKALDKISNSELATINGISKNDMVKDIKKYLNLCKKELELL